MGSVHHLQRAGSSEHEDGQQDVHHKVHGGDIVIVDDDPVGRLCGGFLMDINLPNLDGLGATRRIRETEALREVPVIAITAFGTEGFQRAAYDVGVSGYLTKPIDLDRMHQLIARLLSPTGSGNLTNDRT